MNDFERERITEQLNEVVERLSDLIEQIVNSFSEKDAQSMVMYIDEYSEVTAEFAKKLGWLKEITEEEGES